MNGLLVSQIGYDLRAPMRALLRGATPDRWPTGGTFEIVVEGSGEPSLRGQLSYWGEAWKSHWWVADFSAFIRPGSYQLRLADGTLSDAFEIGEYQLWRASIPTVALDQFERRAQSARFGKGWKDCGSDWREVGSHTGAIIGLCDLLNLGFEALGRADALRLAHVLMHGCDFLLACEQRARDLGWPEGSLVHEMPNYPVLIPQDHGQAVVALAMASRHIYELDAARGMAYLNAARRILRYYTHSCRPAPPVNFSVRAHGAPEGYTPAGFMTAELQMMVWGATALAQAGAPEFLDEGVRRAAQWLTRQVPQSAAEDGLHGHFRTFEDAAFTEKAFTHHHVGHDTSLMFGGYVSALIELGRQLPDHADAPRWRQAVRDFAYGYFLPACRRNPFLLLPSGVFGSEGLLTFAGPWHGFNVCYGYAAALAMQFEQAFGDRAFREIAVGNLQWIAGLNSGLTRASFEGSVMWRDGLPPGTADDAAIAHSMIEGIGRRSVRTWSRIPGAIGSGFCTNRQFQLEVAPTRENDGPWRYSDEDWVPHAGGWCSGLAHLRQAMGWG
jgi:hypothetical protein